MGGQQRARKEGGREGGRREEGGEEGELLNTNKLALSMQQKSRCPF